MTEGLSIEMRSLLRLSLSLSLSLNYNINTLKHRFLPKAQISKKWEAPTEALDSEAE